MGRERARNGQYFCVLIAYVAILLMAGGCTPMLGGRSLERPMPSDLEMGQASLEDGHYAKALKLFNRVLEQSPEQADQALFFIGVVYASPRYEDASYQKALDALQRLSKEYPKSGRHEEADRMVMLLRELVAKDKKNQTLKTQIEALETQIRQMKAVDLDIEEKRRRMQTGN